MAMVFPASIESSLMSSFPSTSSVHTDLHPRSSSSLSFNIRGRRHRLNIKHFHLHYDNVHKRHMSFFVISASSSSSSASNHMNNNTSNINNKFDDIASLFVSLSQTTGQFFESSWHQTVNFFRSYDFQGMMRQGFSAANQKIEEISYDAKRSAEQFNRHFRISERAREMADFTNQQMKNIDEQYGLVQRFRNASTDFRRNIPMYRRWLDIFLKSPLGRILSTLVFLWFLVSGWLFRIMLFSMWVLPLAAPLLINSAARIMTVQGSCPSCKRRFIGYRSQMVVCNYCKTVVWQPRQDFSKGESDPSIIDVEIE